MSSEEIGDQKIQYKWLSIFPNWLKRLKERKAFSLSTTLINSSKYTKIAFLIIAISFFPLCLYFIQSAFYNFNLNQIQQNSQKQLEIRRAKQQEDYQNLLRIQESRNQAKPEATEDKRVAKGTFELNFIFVKPPHLSLSTIEPLLAKLRADNNQLYTSLLYVNTFYQQEAQKYSINDFSLKTNFYGVFDLAELEKVGDIAYIWGKDPFATVRLQDSFINLLAKHNIDQGESNLSVFLYFDDSFGESDPYADNRFYEHKKFRSFANEHLGVAFINVYSFNPNFAEIVTEIAAHETLHLFGASDKYEESASVTRICSPRGKGNPDLNPLIPQTTTDIFCMYVESPDEKFTRGHFSQNNLVINTITAKEIGWME